MVISLPVQTGSFEIPELEAAGFIPQPPVRFLTTISRAPGGLAREGP